MGIFVSYAATVAVLVVIAVFFVVVVKLSGKDSPWLAMVPIVLLLALTLGVNLAILQRCSDEKLTTLTAKLENGMTAQMIVRIDGDEIRSYGPVEIVDEKGILRESYGIDRFQYDDEYREPYRGLFETMTKGKKVSASWHMEREEVADMSKKMIFVKGDSIDRGSAYFIFDTAAMFYGPLLHLGLPLLAVYLVKRRQVRKRKRTAELRRMEIENL